MPKRTVQWGQEDLGQDDRLPPTVNCPLALISSRTYFLELFTFMFELYWSEFFAIHILVSLRRCDCCSSLSRPSWFSNLRMVCPLGMDLLMPLVVMLSITLYSISTGLRVSLRKSTRLEKSLGTVSHVEVAHQCRP